MHSAQSPGSMPSVKVQLDTEYRGSQVILADDSDDTRDFLAHALREDGFEVLEATSGLGLAGLIGEHILAADEKPGIDLIVSDICMPGPSGLEVLARLREEEWATPVLLISAFDDDATHAEARRLGAVGVLHKPFDLDDFRTAVANATAVTALHRR